MVGEGCLWRWWSKGEPEIGLLGFHTAEDRDAFDAGKPGPFRRNVSWDGRTTLQAETWDQRVQRECERAGVPRRSIKQLDSYEHG